MITAVIQTCISFHFYCSYLFVNMRHTLDYLYSLVLLYYDYVYYYFSSIRIFISQKNLNNKIHPKKLGWIFNTTYYFFFDKAARKRKA